jgi:hypothetical protein
MDTDFRGVNDFRQFFITHGADSVSVGQFLFVDSICHRHQIFHLQFFPTPIPASKAHAIMLGIAADSSICPV